MALQSVLMTAILAFSLASTEQCGSSIDLSLHSMKNASGHWIITVDTRRLTRKDDPRKFSVNVQHETRIRGRYEIEEHVLMAFVDPSLHAIEPSTTRPTTTSSAPPFNSTTTTATPSTSTTTTATPSTSKITTAMPSTSTTTTMPSTTTSTITPTSCPHSGYQLYPGFNCYKAFPSEGEYKNWTNAREQCMRDGGDLMVIETERERKEVYIPLHNSVKWSHPWPSMGVYIPQGGNNWMSVKGEPALSTWWRPGEPTTYAASKCAYADRTGLLGNYDCEVTLTFICEISL